MEQVVAVDPSSRLRHVLRIERFGANEAPLLIESESNEVWQIGEFFVRICWRGDPGRLEREGLVAANLPAGIPYPQVISVGRDDVLSWTVTRRLQGVSLAAAWGNVPARERRSAIGQLAQVLIALHAWQPPAIVAEALRYRPPVDPSRPDTIIGADVNPLPTARTLLLVEPARRLPFIDRGVIDAVADRLREMMPLDPFVTTEHPVVVHGDASLTNVLWHQSRLVALLDFEWARWGPPDLELPPLLGYMESEEERVTGFDNPQAPHRSSAIAWLEEDYPDLFGHPDLVSRLWLYELASGLRSVIDWPPRSPEDAQRPDRALGRLRRAVQGPARMTALLGR